MTDHEPCQACQDLFRFYFLEGVKAALLRLGVHGENYLVHLTALLDVYDAATYKRETTC